MEKHRKTDQLIAITLQELRFCRNRIIILCHVKQQLRQRIDSYRFQNQIIAIDNEITILKYEVALLNKTLTYQLKACNNHNVTHSIMKQELTLK
ncbi:uncharacterized protein LOC141525975 isoform X2 [Cotesia typhae]|uniref:uncharacterized protein LOC141525975 isoform X2 n=1 Tax=Cotesia typhae TaxID=2053667 RepID=UPI003D69E317